MNEATRSLGTKLKKGKPTPKEIGGLTSINGLELSAETMDSTTLSNDGGYRSFVAGFKDAGEVTVDGYFDPSSEVGQHDLYTAFESGDIDDYAIEFPNDAKWEFKGLVTGISTGADLEDLISFSATIKVSGKPTLTI